MKFVKRARTFLVVVATGVAACSNGALANSVVYSPPPPLALVALVDPSSGQLGAQLQQLEGVIRSSASPNEAVVVMMLAPGARTYSVRPGDSLSSIAAANNVTLAELEAANPQLGPVSGRNWSLIHSDERVTVPDRGAASPLLLVTRAPAGPPPPSLIRLPTEPTNPTDYQRAQYEHAAATDNATNAARIAAWRSSADQALVPWQNAVVAQLESKASSPNPTSSSLNSSGVAASVAAGLTTLAGLSGRHTLLVLGGSVAGPSSIGANTMAGVALVVANVSDAGAAASWSSMATRAGAASVSTLDPALTQLQLAQVVNR